MKIDVNDENEDSLIDKMKQKEKDHFGGEEDEEKEEE